MSNDVTKTIDQRLEDKHLRPIEAFSDDAVTCVTWHGGNTSALTRHLAAWRESGYDPALLNQNIRTILEFARNTLAKRQFRSDGSREQLIQTLADIEQHGALGYTDHLKRVIEAHDLIEWCDTYVELAAVPATT